MPTSYSYDPATAHVDAALITRNGKSLLITGIGSDHDVEHNRLAELVIGILSKPENDALIAALLGEERP